MDMMLAVHSVAFDPTCLALGCFLSVIAAATVSGTRRRARAKSGNRARHLAAFQKLSSMINRSVQLRFILEFVLEEIISSVGADGGLARFESSGDMPPVFLARGFQPESMALLEGYSAATPSIAQALCCEHPTVVSDFTKWNNGGILSQTLASEGMQFFAIYPIPSGNAIVGSLGLASKDGLSITGEHESLINTLLEMLGVSFANLQLRDQATKFSEDLIALQEVNKIISTSFKLEEIIHRIVAEGRRLVKSHHCHLFLVDDRRQILSGAASTETRSMDIHKVEIELSDKSHCMEALRQKRVIAIEDLLQSGEDNQWLTAKMDWRSGIFAPLLTKDQAIGVLIFSDNARERHFSQEEILRADALAHQAAIALENARLFQVVSRSQKEWETTFDAMKDCVSVHDLKGQVLRANVALAKRLKTSPQKVVGRRCADIYYPGTPSQVSCKHTGSMDGEAVIVEEAEIPAMGGTFEISVSPWFDKHNHLAGSIHVAKDVSNEKLLQRQLIQSEKLSAIGELISGIAHELNNPLTGVMGYSQLLQLRKDIDGQTKDNLIKINNLALRCQKIVQNLLSFARRQKPERTLSNINEILERTVELRSYELQVNNIEIEWNLEYNLPRTIADSHQLQQVFLNIITNAEQAMLEINGHGKLSIETRSDKDDGRIVVEITDNGPGIPEGLIGKIFDPFFTTKEVGKGTGLGLSLAYGIIKEHGGNIYVNSRMGDGSNFVIELPIVQCLSEEAPAIPVLSPQAGSFENLVRDKRVLVVDDERYILDFFVEVFQMYPLQVDTADNGREAMEKILLNHYDLIVTDFKMPHMSGRDLFNWVRSHRPTLARRIVFVTGDTVSTDTRSFFEKNNSCYLAKPFKIEEVKEIIQQTLQGQDEPPAEVLKLT